MLLAYRTEFNIAFNPEKVLLPYIIRLVHVDCRKNTRNEIVEKLQGMKTCTYFPIGFEGKSGHIKVY